MINVLCFMCSPRCIMGPRAKFTFIVSKKSTVLLDVVFSHEEEQTKMAYLVLITCR